MEDSFALRAVETSDLDALANIYMHHWCNYVPDSADKLLASRHCALIQLRRSPLTLACEWEGALVGVCLGCVIPGGKVPTVEAWQPVYEEIHAQALERAKTADDDLEGSLFGDQRELEKADRFVATGSPYAQAQLNLIMVEPWLKGQGVGSLLFDQMKRMMRAAGAEKFFLMSDTASDYSYYEHKGMTCLERYPDDPDDPASWAALMYGGEL